jgi:hypothetical protein
MIVKGVRIDRDLFPITHRNYKRIIKISNSFKQPAQDVLQESMILEMQLTEDIDKPEAYIITSLYNYLKQCRHLSNKSSSIEDFYDGMFIQFSRSALSARIALKETVHYLKSTDSIAADIFQNMVDDKITWHRLYQIKFKGIIGRDLYWKKVWKIQEAVGDILEVVKNPIKSIKKCSPHRQGRISD